MVQTGRSRDAVGMIEIEHVTKRYGDKLAVDDVSFVVQPGIVTGFSAPTGQAGRPRCG
jgi:ABC-2 type transport system ATP-binding protein